MTSASELRTTMQWDSPTPSALFSCLSTLSKYVLEKGATDPNALEAIIRLREIAPEIDSPAIKDAIFSFCREAGLFPYLSETELNWRDRVAYELFRGPTGIDYIFHREQWAAFQHLKRGKNLVLSAPTSFGKSVLIHAYIAETKPDCVVVIVPTIALLDQFRRRLDHYFGADYSIITRNDQEPESPRKRLYVVTQERLLDRQDIRKIDLLAIDEYYKLDSKRDRKKEGGRAELLNAALRRFMGRSKQILFLGPTVADTPMRADLGSQFEKMNSTFSTVAVDVHKFIDSKEPQKTLAGLLKKYGRDKSLVFSKSPPAARGLAKFLAEKSRLKSSSRVREIADWLAEHYHPSWTLVETLKSGYGIHHGSVPRSIGQMLVREFNEGSLQALICTSTLIEGVNTTAKNVFIFDKKISNSDYDYFDFRNIAGRSGRMGHHFVGRVFLFHEPPPATDYLLQIPALGDDENLPNATLLNLPDEVLTGASLARKKALLRNSEMPEEIVKRFASYGDNSLQSISAELREALRSRDSRIVWRGNVGFKELACTFDVAWRHLRFNRGRLSARSAAFFANRLRISGSLRGYFDGLVESKPPIEHPETIEKGFRALSAFDYSIPKLLLDMEMLINFLCDELNIESADYSYMAQGLDNLFDHHWVKALDEYGVPFPLGKKLSFVIRGQESLEDAVDAIRAYSGSNRGKRRLSPIERTIIRDALN